MSQKSDRPEKVPVIPSWCDYNTYSVPQKITFIGITRAILVLTSLCCCIAALVTYDLNMGAQILLFVVATLNVTQLCLISFWIKKARSINQQLTKRLLLIDVVIMVVFLTSVVVLLCILDLETWTFIVGIKFTLLTIYFSFRNIVLYKSLMDQPHEVMLL